MGLLAVEWGDDVVVDPSSNSVRLGVDRDEAGLEAFVQVAHQRQTVRRPVINVLAECGSTTAGLALHPCPPPRHLELWPVLVTRLPVGQPGRVGGRIHGPVDLWDNMCCLKARAWQRVDPGLARPADGADGCGTDHAGPEGPDDRSTGGGWYHGDGDLCVIHARVGIVCALGGCGAWVPRERRRGAAPPLQALGAPDRRHDELAAGIGRLVDGRVPRVVSPHGQRGPVAAGSAQAVGLPVRYVAAPGRVEEEVVLGDAGRRVRERLRVGLVE